MRIKSLRKLALSWAVVSLLLVTPLALAPAAAKPQLTMIDLGTLGGSFSTAVAINNRGQVVGSSTTASGQTHAFLWEDGTMIDLGTLGGDSSEAVTINDRGQVIGFSKTASGQTHAFLWQDGALIDLGTLGGPDSSARAINKHGWVVGSSTTASGQTHAFLWKDGVMTDLGTLGGASSEANAINDRGQVVGSSRIAASSCSRAFLWEDGAMIDLGSFFTGACHPNRPLPSDAALAINNRGQVVGHSGLDIESLERAFLWEKGVMTDLGYLFDRILAAVAINNRGQIVVSSLHPLNETVDFVWEEGRRIPLGTLGGSYTDAVAINERGQVVGSSHINPPWGPGPANPHAFLWEDGVMTDLGTLSPIFVSRSEALAINDRGQVVGWSETAWPAGQRHAFLASK